MRYFYLIDMMILMSWKYGFIALFSIFFKYSYLYRISDDIFEYIAVSPKGDDGRENYSVVLLDHV